MSAAGGAGAPAHRSLTPGSAPLAAPFSLPAARPASLALLLLAWCAAFPSWAAALTPSPLQDTLPGRLVVRAEPAAGTVVVFPQPEEPLAAVRVSVGLAGTGRPEPVAAVLQRLARPRLEAGATALGATLRLRVTPTHAIYALTGAARDLPAMLRLLGDALDPPRADAGALEVARLRTAEAERAVRETPAPLLRARLRAALFPDLSAADGVIVDSTLTPATLEAFRRRVFRPERLAVVVAGGVRVETVAATLADWTPAPPAAPGAARPEVEEGVAAPQLLGPWLAAGLDAPTDASEAALAVAARLVARQLRGTDLRDPTAELWWQGGHRAIALLAGARSSAAAAPGEPDSAAAHAELELRNALRNADRTATPDAVARAARELSRDALLAARTPSGLAEYLGGFLDRTGDPGAGQAMLRALQTVGTEEVQRVLDALLAARPVRVELRP